MFVVFVLVRQEEKGATELHLTKRKIKRTKGQKVKKLKTVKKPTKGDKINKSQTIKGSSCSTASKKKKTRTLRRLSKRKLPAVSPPETDPASASVTAGNKTYTCHDCNKPYRTAHSLSMHRSRIHQPMEPVQCSVCNKVMYNREAVLTHKRLHSGLEPFRCKLCNDCFSSSKQRDVSLTH